MRLILFIESKLYLFILNVVVLILDKGLVGWYLFRWDGFFFDIFVYFLFILKVGFDMDECEGKGWF